jgi:aminocarboxymuconate-semialdehyde decarboxylase
MMSSRRDFFRAIAGATAGAAGMMVMGRQLSGAGTAMMQAEGRRQVMINGRRVRVIDVHAHCDMPLGEVVRGTPFENQACDPSDTGLEGRVAELNEQGVDVQALSINGFWWYEAQDEGLARAICNRQNEELQKFVSQNPDRFVAMASVPLQFPGLAAQILEECVTTRGFRGVTVGGHVNGEDPSAAKYDPFWAKCAEMGELVFMHPGGADNIIREGAFRGRGALGNIMGNPLETTYFLSRMIFDGVFDRHPRLKVCGAHGGGYLPSYFGRTEAACDVRGNANCANTRRPRQILRDNILADTMVFSENGLRHLVAEMGISQVVYGTDNPFNWPVTVDLILGVDFLSDSEKEMILGGNLARLMRINT